MFSVLAVVTQMSHLFSGGSPCLYTTGTTANSPASAPRIWASGNPRRPVLLIAATNPRTNINSVLLCVYSHAFINSRRQRSISEIVRFLCCSCSGATAIVFFMALIVSLVVPRVNPQAAALCLEKQRAGYYLDRSKDAETTPNGDKQPPHANAAQDPLLSPNSPKAQQTGPEK